MGKADDDLTPEERAFFKRIAEGAKPDKAKQEELREARKAIDRALSIRDGLIPPPWAEKPIKPARTKTKAKEGSKEARINMIARGLWPPNGKPPVALSNADIVNAVGDAYERQHKRAVDRLTILRSRAIGRLPRR